MTGRRPHDIWRHFTRVKEGEKPLRAKCKYCNKDMCALVARMKIHIKFCRTNKFSSKSTNEQMISDSEDNESDTNIDKQINSSSTVTSVSDIDITDVSAGSSISQSDSQSHCIRKKQNYSSSSLSHFVTRTNKTESQNIDLQIAKFIYSTNSPFRLVEHEQFKKMLNLLRPGYKPPNRRQIANELLEEVHYSVKTIMENNLKGKIVCMAMDGWSNLHVEPIVCVSVTDLIEGHVHLIDTIDTVDNKHTAEYLLNLAVESIKSCQKFGCSVRSFVTDNASNMAKMRGQLAECDDLGMPDIITYGCSAHILNLLAKDIDVPDLKDDIKTIIKYFRNTHFPAAKFKQAGGSSLNLPIDVRWNSLSDCFESYLKNWHILAKVCTENRIAIDVNICAKIQDLELKTNVQNYSRKLKKINIALDKVQSETCSIGEATEIWLNLEQSIEVEGEEFSEFEISCFKKRLNMAMTPAHYLANLLDHRFRGHKLKQVHLEEALEYAASYHPDAMPYIIKYQAQTSPFREYLFSDQNKESVSPVSWWRALQNSINNSLFDLCIQLHTAVASSAGIERLFSTFGLVHTKLRNRLGTEKAAKLVSIIRAYNTNKMLEDED